MRQQDHLGRPGSGAQRGEVAVRRPPSPTRARSRARTGRKSARRTAGSTPTNTVANSKLGELRSRAVGRSAVPLVEGDESTHRARRRRPCCCTGGRRGGDPGHSWDHRAAVCLRAATGWSWYVLPARAAPGPSRRAGPVDDAHVSGQRWFDGLRKCVTRQRRTDELDGTAPDDRALDPAARAGPRGRPGRAGGGAVASGLCLAPGRVHRRWRGNTGWAMGAPAADRRRPRPRGLRQRARPVRRAATRPRRRRGRLDRLPRGGPDGRPGWAQRAAGPRDKRQASSTLRRTASRSASTRPRGSPQAGPARLREAAGAGRGDASPESAPTWVGTSSRPARWPAAIPPTPSPRPGSEPGAVD